VRGGNPLAVWGESAGCAGSDWGPDAAAGNEAHSALAYPARAPDVIAVGATTEHGCLANYSNDGSRLTGRRQRTIATPR
jgi:subtilisin family serine protease